MIREDDLREAIAECEGSKHPTASTCLKLAAYYTILNHKTEVPQRGYSYASEPEIQYSTSEFSQLVQKRGIQNCFPIIDEAMSALLMVNPQLYNNIIRKLSEV